MGQNSVTMGRNRGSYEYILSLCHSSHSGHSIHSSRYQTCTHSSHSLQFPQPSQSTQPTQAHLCMQKPAMLLCYCARLYRACLENPPCPMLISMLGRVNGRSRVAKWHPAAGNIVDINLDRRLPLRNLTPVRLHWFDPWSLRSSVLRMMARRRLDEPSRWSGLAPVW